MGQHTYLDAGPASSEVADNGTVIVKLRDAADTMRLAYSDLDTLDETIFLFQEARAKLVQNLRRVAEPVAADHLGDGDVIVADGAPAIVVRVVLGWKDASIVYRQHGDTATWNVGRHDFIPRLHTSAARGLSCVEPLR